MRRGNAVRVHTEDPEDIQARIAALESEITERNQLLQEAQEAAGAAATVLAETRARYNQARAELNEAWAGQRRAAGRVDAVRQVITMKQRDVLVLQNTHERRTR